jgi:hypothetical protein
VGDLWINNRGFIFPARIDNLPRDDKSPGWLINSVGFFRIHRGNLFYLPILIRVPDRSGSTGNLNHWIHSTPHIEWEDHTLNEVAPYNRRPCQIMTRSHQVKHELTSSQLSRCHRTKFPILQFHNSLRINFMSSLQGYPVESRQEEGPGWPRTAVEAHMSTFLF